jgi:hypothetical protein
MALNAGINTTNFMLAINGAAGGFLNSFTAPDFKTELIKVPLGPDGISPQAHGNFSLSDPKFSFALSHVGPLWDIMNSVLQKQCVEFQARIDLANQNYESMRAVELINCLVKELSFSNWEGKDGKGLAEVTMTCAIEDAKYLKGDKKKLQATAKNNAKRILKSNFRTQLPGGLKGESVLKFETPKLTCKVAREDTGASRAWTNHYAAWELSNAKTEHSHTDHDALIAYVTNIMKDGNITPEEYGPMAVEVLSHNLKETLMTFEFTGCAPYEFKWAPELKGGQDTMVSSTVSWTTETFKLTPGAHLD